MLPRILVPGEARSLKARIQPDGLDSVTPRPTTVFYCKNSTNPHRRVYVLLHQWEALDCTCLPLQDALSIVTRLVIKVANPSNLDPDPGADPNHRVQSATINPDPHPDPDPDPDVPLAVGDRFSPSCPAQ
jgi:hypothetical protein